MATSGLRDGGRASPASATGLCLLAAPARLGQEVGRGGQEVGWAEVGFVRSGGWLWGQKLGPMGCLSVSITQWCLTGFSFRLFPYCSVSIKFTEINKNPTNCPQMEKSSHFHASASFVSLGRAQLSCPSSCKLTFPSTDEKSHIFFFLTACE